jgi:hypothetical protein
VSGVLRVAAFRLKAATRHLKPTVEQLTCEVMAIIERLPLVRSAK